MASLKQDLKVTLEVRVESARPTRTVVKDYCMSVLPTQAQNLAASS